MKMGQLHGIFLIIFTIIWSGVAKINFVFPRDGDSLFPLECDTAPTTSCVYEIYVLLISSFEENKLFNLHIETNDVSFVHRFDARNETHSSYQWYGKIQASVQHHSLDVSLRLVDALKSAEVLSSKVRLLLLNDEDLPPVEVQEYHPPECRGKRCKLDFVDIGTSNFNACSHRMMELQAHYPQRIFRGVSVEPMRRYLAELPSSPHHVKVNAAVKLSHSPASSDFLYYIPPSIINRGANLPAFLKGCSSLHRPAQILLGYIAHYDHSLTSIQRNPVRLLTAPYLLDNYVHSSEMNGVRLLKTDMEGMDSAVMVSVLDFYESRSLWLRAAMLHNHYALSAEQYLYCNNGNLITATSSWPCMIRFETITFGVGLTRDPILLDRFRALGYFFFHDLPSIQTLEASPEGSTIQDTIAIQCACSREDLAIAKEFASIFDHTEMINQHCRRLQ